VLILYGDGNFVCRKCRGISYQIQRIAPSCRALARAQLLRAKLGASLDVSAPLPPKPKGMHSWTYTKLGIRVLVAERKAAAELLQALPRPATCSGGEPKNA
jgi:hypothetical protein